MGKGDDSFTYESIQDREMIAKYLEALNEGFATGKLLFGSKHKQMNLEPQGLIRFDVVGRRKDGQIKLKLKFSWKEEKKPKPVKNDPLVIKPDGK